MKTEQGEQHAEQTFDRVRTDGTFSNGPDGRLTFAGQSQGTGFHMIGHGPNGFSSDTSARAMAGHFSMEGLDRVQGTRLLTAFRAMMAGVGPGQTPDQPVPAASPELRRQMDVLLDAANGLLNRVEVDETMEDMRFTVGTANGGSAGTIGSLRLTMAGEAVQERLNGRVGIVVEGIAVPAMAAETGALIPHHADLTTVLAGIRTGPLMALLRSAVEGGRESAELQTQAMALLSEPGVRVGIEALSFDAGPLSVTGSAKLLPRANGEMGGEIHIAARGVDALLARMQGQPKLQQAMPMIFMAKGIGRPQGDSLVWDIALGNGPLTVNGMPFGQPGRKTR